MAIEEGATDCPFCSENSCDHLVYDIDESFAEVLDGTFCGLEKQAKEIVDKAILQFLKAIEGKTDKAKDRAHAKVLPELLSEQIPYRVDPGTELDESLLDDNDYPFRQYLYEILEEVADYAESYQDLGGPGQSSSCMRYYAKNGEKCAKRVLTRMRSDAAALRRLAKECRAKTK
jgi:hypothetical protein